MKAFLILIVTFAAYGLACPQTCGVPSLRGLKLGMTAQAVDAVVVSDADLVLFDDATYKLTFTRNKLVRIDAEYRATTEWTDLKGFAELYAKRLNLPNEWRFVNDAMRLKQLEEEKIELLRRYTPGYFKIKEVDEEIKVLRRGSLPTLHCPQFSVNVVILDSGIPRVTLRLTNRSRGTGTFEP